MEAVARLRRVPTSPRKMRLIVHLIRGEQVNRALNILKFEPKRGKERLEKLLLSAIANWQQKNSDIKLEDAELYIKEIRVDSGRMLKRFRPAPHGRANRIRKRSNHVTLIIDGLALDKKKDDKEQKDNNKEKNNKEKTEKNKK